MRDESRQPAGGTRGIHPGIHPSGQHGSPRRRHAVAGRRHDGEGTGGRRAGLAGGPRSIRAVAGRGPSVLTEIRAGRHGRYERLVLEFTAPYGAVQVRYVPVVRADPSGQVVPLRGRSFLEVVIRGAAAGHAAAPITPYLGPATLTPGYPVLRQVSACGDFESVLSLGAGLSRTAGFRVQQLTGPDRLMLDVAEPPAWRMWPEDGLAQARAEQAAADRGHQPWRVSAEEVAKVYADAVYGWDYRSGGLEIAPVPGAPGHTFRLAAKGSSDSVAVRAAPCSTGRTASSRSPIPGEATCIAVGPGV
jgi:hypothetical protein